MNYISFRRTQLEGNSKMNAVTQRLICMKQLFLSQTGLQFQGE